jgi:hypothetical protein
VAVNRLCCSSTDNLSPVAPGTSRFVFAQAVDVPAFLNVKNPKTFTLTVSPGKQQAISVPDGTYLVQVVAAGSSTVLASEQISLADQSATFTYAAGESSNNSVRLISRTVQEVF